MTDYFLDYEGSLNARAQFHRRSMDLASAASTILPTGEASDPALAAAGHLLSAFSGRLFAYGDELSMLSQLVGDVVTVTNQVDVDLAAATP